MPEHIYLMDASAFIHRAFHAIRNLKNKNGQPTGAAYGFTATLLKLLKDKNPAYLAVVFDSRGPSARHQLYPAYKANRPPMDQDLAAQQPFIRDITGALGLCRLEQPGFEADDLIAALALRYSQAGHQVTIVSADKDFYQLLTDNVTMYDPDPKKSSAMTALDFKERFGFEPALFLDMQALMGDPSDNIPGVPKVGEKTAQKLITQFQTLDNLYSRLDEVTPESLKERLRENEESARLSRELASLGHGADPALDLADLAVGAPDPAAVTEIFTVLDFNRLLKEVLPGGQTPKSTQGGLFDQPAAAPQAQTYADNQPSFQAAISYDGYRLVDNDEAWDELMAELKKAQRLAIDLETDSPRPSRTSLVGLSLCATEGRAFYIPVGHNTLGAQNQPWEKVKDKIGPFLLDPAIKKIGQNAKFDWLILNRYGLPLPPPADDPMLASYLINPEERHGLDHLSPRYLGHRAIPFKEMVPNAKSNFGDISPDEALNYAAEDADLTYRLAGILRTRLEEHPQLLNLYEDVELPLEDILAKIEAEGVLLDVERLRGLSAEYALTLKETESKIFELAGRPFNIASPQQLSTVLFDELGLPHGKKTAKKTGYSTDDEVLSNLADIHPVAAEIRNWRGLAKLKSTYTDKLPQEINPQTGRVHTSYNQTLTATGRLSSSDPNLQNIPAKGDDGHKIRGAFIARPGYKLVSADYSQIELRVLAHISQDEALLKAFENNEDIHTQTAARIFGLPPEQITPAQRREAKTINFGVVYGQGPFGLARQLGVPQALARDFIEKYFERFPGVKRYMEETRTLAAQQGYVTTWFGRVRHLPGLTGGGYQARQEAERMAINTPIQGTAADLIKMAMVAVYNRLLRENPQSRLIMQVHDELVVETPEKDADQVSAVLVDEMVKVGHTPPIRGAKGLSAPLKADVGQGYTWAEAH